jgi:nucleotide-binding universal stress UspA family protein
MFKHLLVTLDSTARSETVIPHAVDLARAMHAQLTLLCVVDAVNAEWSERGAVGKGSSPDSLIRTIFAEQAEAYLSRVAQQIRSGGVQAQTMVKQGQPAKQIVAAAREVKADAIAMSTRSRRGINRLMFGSVAEAVLHGSHLPVLLVRAE